MCPNTFRCELHSLCWPWVKWSVYVWTYWFCNIILQSVRRLTATVSSYGVTVSHTDFCITGAYTTCINDRCEIRHTCSPTITVHTSFMPMLICFLWLSLQKVFGVVMVFPFLICFLLIFSFENWPAPGCCKRWRNLGFFLVVSVYFVFWYFCV